MTAAANTLHTITNALMICFSSETDIASGSGVANDPGLAADRGRRSLRSRSFLAWQPFSQLALGGQGDRARRCLLFEVKADIAA